MREEGSTAGVYALQTASAAVTATISYFVVKAPLFMFFYWREALTSYTRPEAIEVGAAAFSSILAAMAAKFACDRVFRGYSSQAVFLVFVGLGAFVFWTTFTSVEFGYVWLLASAHWIPAIVTAYIAFWLDR